MEISKKNLILTFEEIGIFKNCNMIFVWYVINFAKIESKILNWKFFK